MELLQISLDSQTHNMFYAPDDFKTSNHKTNQKFCLLSLVYCIYDKYM